MLIVACFFLAAGLLVAGVALTFGAGPALIAAGGCLFLLARDLSTPSPGGSL